MRRALAISVVFHAAIVGVAWQSCDPNTKHEIDLINIEMAPTPPPVEALPQEVARAPVEDLASKQQEKEETFSPPPVEPADIPVDAAVDAEQKAPPDAEEKVAKIDAAEPDATDVAVIDAGVAEDATDVAVADATTTGDADVVATGSGAGSNTGTGSGSGSGGQEVGSGSGVAGVTGVTNDPAVDGAPTTAGTAANLLAYFPAGHEVTAMIRFDRLRGTEWAAKTERLLQPMPDYRLLFGLKEAKIYDKLETLVISTPSPRDPTATTLVGHTRLPRAELRAFLGAVSPVTWSTSKGGVLGKRRRTFRGDLRVYLSPFDGWFLLAQPSDLAGLTAPAGGNLDTVQATGKLPAWLAGVRKIESESGDPRGPTLVVTLALDGSAVSTGPFEMAIGIKDVQLPERVSLAMEIVKQGWVVRGNMRFKTEAQAIAFVTQVQTVQGRIVGAAGIYEKLVGKAAINMTRNFKFARTGARVSYTTSMSIADMRALFAVAAMRLDAYYKAAPPP